MIALFTKRYWLKTSRPKAEVNLPKPKFGIPESANQYLFVNNHDSVVHFDSSLREAFNQVIDEMPSMGEGFPPAKKMANFVKVFYEGGFGYNKKDSHLRKRWLTLSRFSTK